MPQICNFCRAILIRRERLQQCSTALLISHGVMTTAGSQRGQHGCQQDSGKRHRTGSRQGNAESQGERSTEPNSQSWCGLLYQCPGYSIILLPGDVPIILNAVDTVHPLRGKYMKCRSPQQPRSSMQGGRDWAATCPSWAGPPPPVRLIRPGHQHLATPPPQLLALKCMLTPQQLQSPGRHRLANLLHCMRVTSS